MEAGDVLDLFLPPVREWFRRTLGEPTPPQRLGWPAIAAGQNTLILAPTGSGKTLAAFLACLDVLWRQSSPGSAEASPSRGTEESEPFPSMAPGALSFPPFPEAFQARLLERLEALRRPGPSFVRIGLSATQRPLEEVARYLGGQTSEGPRPVTIVDAGLRKDLDLGVLSPVEQFGPLPEKSIWPS